MLAYLWLMLTIIVVWPCDSDSGAQVRKYISSESIGKEFEVNEVCCIEWAQTTLKLQVI